VCGEWGIIGAYQTKNGAPRASGVVDELEDLAIPWRPILRPSSPCRPPFSGSPCDMPW